MFALKVRFLAGRYHATGWDHQVNEGTVEWPPSPWRLLRALVAASYRLVERPTDAELSALLEPLAETLPAYRVPPFTTSHTRHYMPLDNKGLPGDKSSKIFNAFVAPGTGPGSSDGELVVVWPDVELPDALFSLAHRLCDQIGYLGRAESWAAIQPWRVEELANLNCIPASDRVVSSRVRLMAPARRGEHLAWYESLTGKRKGVPESLLDVLRQDVGEIRKKGWSSVPGARWVVYDLDPASLPARRRRLEPKTPTHALYRIAGPVLPSVEKTLQTAERFHQALVRWSARVSGSPQQVFVGTKRPAKGERESGHAAVLPLDADRDGKIDHLLVRATDGFDLEARCALERGRTIYGVGAYPFTVTLLGTWTSKELTTLSPADALRCLGPSRRWQSITPFVLVRHPKIRSNGSPRLDDDGTWVDGPEAQLRLELERRGLPSPVEVQRLDALRLGGRQIPWHRFQRERTKGGGTSGPNTGYGFTITFAEPISGPLGLGYGRFFGLGQFAPID